MWERFALLWGRPFLARHFPEGARAFALERGAGGRLGGGSSVIAEFDGLASEYEARLALQPFQRLLRDRALRLLEQRFPTPSRLVELGPGPGTQTLPLLRRGHSILAIDPSERMLNVLSDRARTEGLSDRLSLRRGTAGEVVAAGAPEPTGAFDGAYSMFGALSLEPDLDRLLEGLAHLLRPGAAFLAGIQNHWGLVAALERAAAGRPGSGLDRLRPRLEVKGRQGLLVAATTTPSRLGRSARPYFEVEEITALSVLVPDFPAPRLERLAGPKGLARLARLDAGLSRFRAFGAIADHLVVTLRRRAGPAGTREVTI